MYMYLLNSRFCKKKAGNGPQRGIGKGSKIAKSAEPMRS